MYLLLIVELLQRLSIIDSDLFFPFPYFEPELTMLYEIAFLSLPPVVLGLLVWARRNAASRRADRAPSNHAPPEITRPPPHLPTPGSSVITNGFDL